MMWLLVKKHMWMYSKGDVDIHWVVMLMLAMLILGFWLCG